MDKQVEELSHAITDFCDYISKLSSADFTLSKTSKWGPKEVLIHLVFWHEQYCKILFALLNHQKPVLLTGKFNQLNALAVIENKHETKEVLLHRLQIAQKNLGKLCKNSQAKKILMAFKEGGMFRPLPLVVEKIEAHIRSHQRQLIRAGFRVQV